MGILLYPISIEKIEKIVLPISSLSSHSVSLRKRNRNFQKLQSDWKTNLPKLKTKRKKLKNQKENKQREIFFETLPPSHRSSTLHPLSAWEAAVGATDNFKIPLTPFSYTQPFVNTSGGGQITSTHPSPPRASYEVAEQRGSKGREGWTFRRRGGRRRPLIPVYNRLLTVGEINTVINNIRWPEPRKKRPLLAGRQAQKAEQLRTAPSRAFQERYVMFRQFYAQG